MDRNTSYATKFFVKCLLFLERQLQQRRHKLSMANQDESLHQPASRSTTFERLSSNESYFESVGHNDTSLINEKGDMGNESKGINGSEGGRPKKSLFEITRVENTDNRGESGGIDNEDVELDDTFTDLPEVSSPLEGGETVRNNSVVEESGSDKNPGSSSNGSEVSQAHTSSVALTSRFKIVKVARAEPYRRGRWTCQEFMDTSSESKISDRNLSETRTTSGVESRDLSCTTSFSSKERKDGDQKILLDNAENRNDEKNVSNSGAETIPVTRGGVPASSQSLIDRLETQSEHLAHFVEG